MATQGDSFRLWTGRLRDLFVTNLRASRRATPEKVSTGLTGLTGQPDYRTVWKIHKYIGSYPMGKIHVEFQRRFPLLHQAQKLPQKIGPHPERRRWPGYEQVNGAADQCRVSDS